MSNKKGVHHPHDSAFKHGMSDIKVAREVIEQHLPKEVLKLFKLDTLELKSASYIDASLKASHSDILYAAKTVAGDAYVYCLIEHQSKPLEFMPLRLIEYVFKIMVAHLKQGHKKLPLVVPLIIYAGKEPYNYSTDLFELFDSPDIARELMFKPFSLIDLSTTDDSALMQSKWASFFLMIMKHIQKRDILKTLESLSDSGIVRYITSHDGEDLAAGMLYYICNDPGIKNKKEFLNKVKNIAKDFEESAMTVINEFRQEGIEQGIEQGYQSAMQHIDVEKQQAASQAAKQAAHEKEVEIAKKMLLMDTSFEVISDITGLAITEVKKLKQSITH